MPLTAREKALCLVPCFNEAANLPELLRELESPALHGRCDLLLLDDGSRDETAGLLQGSGHPVIHHPANLGYGAAIKSGLRYARDQGYRYLAVFPGDRQRSIEDLLRLVQEIESGPIDLVVGNKLHAPVSIPWKRALGNRFFSVMARALWRAPFRDVLSGFKAYRIASVTPFLEQLPDRYEFDLVLSLYCGKLGLTVREIPVSVRYHAHSTKMTSEVGVGLKMLKAALKSFYGKGGKPAVVPLGD
ncbi:glycosyltransferase family 2 protein [bacterium]|nr:MAG: glycosyltransferase family 2 protein [bacterium]